MHPFSHNSDCLTAKPSQNSIFSDLLKKLPFLTSIQDGKRYPIILGMRVNGVDLYFLRLFEETVESTTGVFAACISAYQPEQIVLSYLTDDIKPMGGTLPPYTLNFYGVKDPMANLFIGKCQLKDSHYELSEIVGKVEDPTVIEQMDFLFKDAFFHFFGNISEQRKAGEDYLNNWRPDVLWGFEDIKRGELPPEYK